MSVRQYTILEELGRGTFGVTYLGYDNNNGRNVAIKTIDINKSQQLGADINSIYEEIETLKQLSQDGCYIYLACYYESFEDNFNGVHTMFIISEYIKGQSLTQFINQYNGGLIPSVLWPVMLQLMIGLQYIHNKGYAHRDIKPDNVLITEDLTIKYIDFGLACLDSCRMSTCNNTCKGSGGTLLYMPPEFFNGTREDSIDASKAHDIWSLTMVMFELANGLYRYPFAAFDANGNLLSSEQITANISQSPQFQSSYTFDDGRTNRFLDSLVVTNWRMRPTIDIVLSRFINEILARPWQ